jgi:hypothetical protein
MKMVDRLIEPRDLDFKYQRKNMLRKYSRKDWVPYWWWTYIVFARGAFW